MLKVDVWMPALLATTQLLVSVATVIGVDTGEGVGDLTGLLGAGALVGARGVGAGVVPGQVPPVLLVMRVDGVAALKAQSRLPPVLMAD